MGENLKRIICRSFQRLGREISSLRPRFRKTRNMFCSFPGAQLGSEPKYCPVIQVGLLKFAEENLLSLLLMPKRSGWFCLRNTLLFYDVDILQCLSSLTYISIMSVDDALTKFTYQGLSSGVIT